MILKIIRHLSIFTKMEEEATVKTLTAKQMKNLAKPEFAKNPE